MTQLRIANPGPDIGKIGQRHFRRHTSRVNLYVIFINNSNLVLRTKQEIGEITIWLLNTPVVEVRNEYAKQLYDLTDPDVAFLLDQHFSEGAVVLQERRSKTEAPQFPDPTGVDHWGHSSSSSADSGTSPPGSEPVQQSKSRLQITLDGDRMPIHRATVGNSGSAGIGVQFFLQGDVSHPGKTQ